VTHDPEENDDDSRGLPPRLIDGKDHPGELLRRFARGQATPDADLAWRQLLPRLAGQERRGPRRLGVLAWGLGALAGTAVLLLVWQRVTSRPAGPVSFPPALAERSAPPHPRPPAERAPPLPQESGEAARALPAGRVDLGAARAQLSPGTAARARTTAAGVEVELVSGRLALEVPPQLAGRRVEVVSGPYRFVVLGTVFRLERQGPSLRLAVQEGKVSVHRGERLISVVSAGQSWTPSMPSGAARSPAPPPPDALAEELSTYELGRVRRDQADLAGALQAFRDCRRRFPQGTLRTEVDLSIVELLPRLGRFQEALAESADFLAAHPHGERTAELHRLRGDIYRQALKDPARAEHEYALGRLP
jgi:hypothetical protein